jgi:hypothetical protein
VRNPGAEREPLQIKLLGHRLHAARVSKREVLPGRPHQLPCSDSLEILLDLTLASTSRLDLNARQSVIWNVNSHSDIRNVGRAWFIDRPAVERK